MNAYILTGGQSRRLKQTKSLAILNGRTLTELVFNNLRLIFENVFVVGKTNEFPDIEFIPDLHAVQCPLNGIVTALEHSKDGWIFVIACDLPFVSSHIIKDLLDQIETGTQIVLPIIETRLQPLCAFYHGSVLDYFKNGINSKNYSLISKFENLSVKGIAIQDKDTKQFLNINYPEDLVKATDLLKTER